MSMVMVAAHSLPWDSCGWIGPHLVGIRRQHQSQRTRSQRDVALLLENSRFAHFHRVSKKSKYIGQSLC
jgi:hypothetical protein